MRIIVFSDTHGNFSAMHKIFKRNNSADCFVFLGDGLDELEDIKAIYPEKKILSVSGNCDFGALRPSADVALIGGMRVFYTHGHRYDVRYSTAKLKAKAKELGANVVLYGHTHRAEITEINGITFINPGCVERYAAQKSFCYAVISGDNITAVINQNIG